MSSKSKRPFRHPSGRIDWKQVAQLLSMGCGLHEAAIVVGCPVDRIRRNLRRSARFRFWIEDAAATARAKARVQFRTFVRHSADRVFDAQSSGRIAKSRRLPGSRRVDRAPKTGPELAESGTKLAFSRTERA